jgi:hypothetical protein
MLVVKLKPPTTGVAVVPSRALELQTVTRVRASPSRKV